MQDLMVALDVQGHSDTTLCLRLLIGLTQTLNYRSYDTFLMLRIKDVGEHVKHESRKKKIKINKFSHK